MATECELGKYTLLRHSLIILQQMTLCDTAFSNEGRRLLGNGPSTQLKRITCMQRPEIGNDWHKTGIAFERMEEDATTARPTGGKLRHKTKSYFTAGRIPVSWDMVM
ncbi:hypothetical protein AJ80_02356 [Polytolypa hystricis UAMH7299]|uniref:Uncharacterized protein n=1 Tax=Polytolypa hystricis (strain UAMH7299) TaxID=1447883 RepID=A0A2B7YPI8_POLH7|nr:hypothetical protein AJ80_02356 [Polytolypa hystricis UAMH7299]